MLIKLYSYGFFFFVKNFMLIVIIKILLEKIILNKKSIGTNKRYTQNYTL